MANKTEGASAPKIDRAIQDRIGRELRGMYDELLRQPLPERLLETLRAADELHTARQQLGETAQAMRRATKKRRGGPATALPKAKGA